ncbi:hypothetical protein AAHE18_19G063300 [Arachis hypogaea]
MCIILTPLMLRSTKFLFFMFPKRFFLQNLCTSSVATIATNVHAQIYNLSIQGNLEEALSLLYTHDTTHSFMSIQTYATLFHACARRKCLQHGMALHHYVIDKHPEAQNDLFLTNHIINMYCKCGHLAYAHHLFDKMLHRNIVSWTALISGYAQCGLVRECFSLFSSLLASFCRPNEFALASLLSACEAHDIKCGMQVHAVALKIALDASLYVANALITMYSKCSAFGGCYDHTVDDAWILFKSMKFKNLISWNSMIAGFQFRGLAGQAVWLFTHMYSSGIGFDRATLLSVFSSLNECSTFGDINIHLRSCFQLHCLAIKSALCSEVEVITALLKSYANVGGDIADCYRLFLETSQQDIVSWTAIMTVFAERDPEQAFLLFCQLHRESFVPDWHTFSIALKACAYFVTEKHALAVHSQVIKRGFQEDTVLCNALLHAYARCGSLSLSEQVFEEMKFRDLVSWNSMIKSYALHGQTKDALKLFQQINMHPDATTFVALLSACSHVGLVDQGVKIFNSMSDDHGIVPQLDHYACMVDLYGRAGKLSEAEDLIRKMPMKPDSVIWSSLLGSCRKYGETHLAKLAANKFTELAPNNSLGYVQMSNIYSSGGSFAEASLVRKEMRDSKVRKEPGLSWVQIGMRVHEFASGGQHHPQRVAILNRLEILVGQLKEIGYAPEINLALYDTEMEHKENQLLHHSEKMALVFAIMNEEKFPFVGNVVKIMKNIRICVDCHNFMKLASYLLQKEITVRDSNRFHHFKYGACSCNDYW